MVNQGVEINAGVLVGYLGLAVTCSIPSANSLKDFEYHFSDADINGKL